MKMKIRKSAILLSSFLLWAPQVIQAQETIQTDNTTSAQSTETTTPSITSSTSLETPSTSVNQMTTETSTETVPNTQMTTSNTTTSETTTSEETIPENTTDPYFPKQPTKEDLAGDKILPGTASEALMQSRVFTASSGMNQEIIKQFESGSFKLATIQKNWREYELFRYRTLDDSGEQAKPNGIVIHETANPNSTIWGEIAYMDSHWENAFVHAFVDENNIVEIHDPSYGAWGAGRIANRYFMHVELVEHGNRTSFMKSIMNNAYYMAMKLDQFGLTPSAPSGKANDNSGTLWSHAEVSNYLGGTDHGDPVGYFAKYGYSVNEYRELVRYMYDKFSLAPVITSTAIENINQTQKTFDVRVKATANSGIKEINVPVWTTANQSDIKWYKATLQNDGSYIAKIEAKNHASFTQPFHVHVYAVGNNTKQTAKVLSDVKFDGPSIQNVTTAVTDNAAGKFSISFNATAADAKSLQTIQVNAWSTESPQVVKTVKLSPNTQGNYTASFNAQDFGYSEGPYRYEIKVVDNQQKYAQTTGNGPTFAFNYKVVSHSVTELSKDHSLYEAKLKLEDNQMVDSVMFAVWSEINGQDDLKWYPGTFDNATKTWSAKLPITNHKDSGVYHVHHYVKTKSGKMRSVGADTFTVKPLQITTTIDTAKQKQGQASINVQTNDNSMVQSVSVTIQPKNKPNDSHTYATTATSGGYQASMDIKNHGYQTGAYTGKVTVTRKNGVAETKTLSEFTVSGTNVTLAMYRVYNPNSGEHFYTMQQSEKNNLVKLGWKDEGTGWIAPAVGKPVYRVYNPDSGDHHYTLAVAEKNHLVKLGWKDEGIGWYSATEATHPLYRVYNPNAKAGSHHYTQSLTETNNLVKKGWKDEGIAWYAVK